MIFMITIKAKKMYKNKNKNTRDKATQPANATRTVYYEELDELQLERWSAGWGWINSLGAKNSWLFTSSPNFSKNFLNWAFNRHIERLDRRNRGNRRRWRR